MECEACGHDYSVRDGMDPTPLCDACAHKAVETLRDLADSEGTRAVEYLRRARKAEQLLREIAEHVSQYSDHTEDSFRRGLVALMVPTHKVLKAVALTPNVI